MKICRRYIGCGPILFVYIEIYIVITQIAVIFTSGFNWAALVSIIINSILGYVYFNKLYVSGKKVASMLRDCHLIGIYTLSKPPFSLWTKKQDSSCIQDAVDPNSENIVFAFGNDSGYLSPWIYITDGDAMIKIMRPLFIGKVIPAHFINKLSFVEEEDIYVSPVGRLSKEAREIVRDAIDR